LDEGEVVGGKPVVARRDPTTLLDPVEEPFDPVASAVEIRAEADRIVAIAFGRDVRARMPSASDSTQLHNRFDLLALADRGLPIQIFFVLNRFDAQEGHHANASVSEKYSSVHARRRRATKLDEAQRSCRFKMLK